MCCSGSNRNQQPTPIEPVVDIEPAADAAPEDPPPGGPRALGAPMTFATLVTAANVLDERGEVGSEADCMLRRPERAEWPWILEAEIAAAVRPLPEPPDDLDARLIDSTSPVLAITRWGQIGSRSYGVAVAAFTNAPPTLDQPATVVIATNRGAYVRLTDRLVSAGRTRPVDLSALSGEIANVADEGQMIYVTAEAVVPLERLRSLLAVLPEGSPVALAVALGDEIRVPDPPEPPPDRGTGLCPDGLPELAEAEQGELETTLIVGALGPLRAAVQDCMAQAAGTRAAGGLVELTMRIGPEGRVTDACLISDEVGGTELRTCLIRAAQATPFPAPRPTGSVDVRLPLRLQPSYQRALCD